jgi:hypothetical protein
MVDRDRMPGVNELPDDMLPNEARSADDEDIHGS